VGVVRGVRRAPRWTPMAANALPEVLATGFSRASVALRLAAIFHRIGAAGAGLWRQLTAVAAPLLCVCRCMWVRMAPHLDERYSARPTWKAIEDRRTEVCVESMHRSWRYD